MNSEFLKNELLEVGDRLKHLRMKLGYTSAEKFAMKNDLPTEQYIAMESGRTHITLKGLLRVLAVHKMTLEEFFCYEPKKAAA